MEPMTMRMTTRPSSQYDSFLLRRSSLDTVMATLLPDSGSFLKLRYCMFFPINIFPLVTVLLVIQ